MNVNRKRRCDERDCHSRIMGCGDTNSRHARQCLRNRYCRKHYVRTIMRNKFTKDIHGAVERASEHCVAPDGIDIADNILNLLQSRALQGKHGLTSLKIASLLNEELNMNVSTTAVKRGIRAWGEWIARERDGHGGFIYSYDPKEGKRDALDRMTDKEFEEFRAWMDSLDKTKDPLAWHDVFELDHNHSYGAQLDDDLS